MACSKPGGEVDTPPPPQAIIRTITCETGGYTLDEHGTVEIPFRVKDSKAIFNYAASSAGFQVELRLKDNIGSKPEEFSLLRVRADEQEQGLYYAMLSDMGSGRIYSRMVHIAIKLDTGELILSNAVRVASWNYSGGISGVRLSKSSNPTLKRDVEFTYDTSSNTFHAHIDDYVSDRVFIPEFTTEGVDSIEINGAMFDNAGTPVDLSKRVVVIAHMAGTTREYNLQLSCFTGLPVLRIETPNRQNIWSKEQWVEGSKLWLDGMAQFESIEDADIAIRGRGNSTWGYEKKPYAIKFTEKREVMGMPKHKRWVLLANYMDRTLLRNRVAFYLAQQTSLAWTPHCEFVELILNGVHIGQYLLCEQVRVDNDRIDITEMTPQDNAGDAITGGYLLELDFHYDNMWQWRTPRNVPFAVKYPDEEDLTEQQYAWIRSYIEEVETTLYGSNYKDAENGYRKYIDAQSFIDYWLIYEICVNHELANPGSVYLWKDRGGKLHAGPVWDFDWGTFSFKASPAAESGLFMQWAWWYGRLFDDPYFKALASERWAILKPKFESVFDFIERERAYISASWNRNFEVWRNISTDINGDERLTQEQAIDRMVDILRTRIAIIDNAL
jgi:hypothetical protein